MSNIYSIHEKQKLKHHSATIEEERLDSATKWISRLDRKLSEEEEKSLKKWLASTPANLEVLLEVAHLWDKMNELTRLADLFPQSITVEKRSNYFPLAALAASIVVIFSAAIFFNTSEHLQHDHNQSSTVVSSQKIFRTDIGESKTIRLPDASTIVLNTDTHAEIQFTPEARIIKLKQGEINVDVAHDKSRPLSVIAEGKIIQAVGTVFNVEIREDSVELIVTDGKVLIAPVKEELTDSTYINDIDVDKFQLPDTSVAVSKGEKINIKLTGQQDEMVLKVDPIDIAASLSWRQGNLIFRGEYLADAMAEISRYSDVDIRLDENDNLKQIRIAGMFRTGDIPGLLNMLEQNFNIHSERINQQTIFLKLVENN